MNRKKNIFIIGILCLFVVTASFIQIYRVNAAYPSAKQVYIPFSKIHMLEEGINLSGLGEFRHESGICNCRDTEYYR